MNQPSATVMLQTRDLHLISQIFTRRNASIKF